MPVTRVKKDEYYIMRALPGWEFRAANLNN